MVCCVQSLESPRWGNSNENTQHTFMLKKIEKISVLNLTWRYNQPSLAWTTPVSNSFSRSHNCSSHWSSTVITKVLTLSHSEWPNSIVFWLFWVGWKWKNAILKSSTPKIKCWIATVIHRPVVQILKNGNRRSWQAVKLFNWGQKLGIPPSCSLNAIGCPQDLEIYSYIPF